MVSDDLSDDTGLYADDDFGADLTELGPVADDGLEVDAEFGAELDPELDPELDAGES